MDKEILADIADKLTALAESLKKALAPKAGIAVTLEDVRSVLSRKSCRGYTDAVKALIQRFGADRLSDVSPDHYEALLREAEAIGNE